MNGYAGNDQVLCERLKAKFASRGAAAVLGRNVPTSELMKKISTTVSPYEATAELQKTKPVNKQVTLASEAKQAPARRAQTQVARPTQAQTTARPAQVQTQAKANAAAYAYDGTYARAYARAADIKVRAEQVRRDKAKIRNIAATATMPSVGTRANTASVAKQRKALTSRTFANEGFEVKTKAKSFPIELVILLAVCTVAVILVVYTIAQMYSFTSDISALKKKQGELNKTESSLMLELNERDDIRLIEKIAVEEIGMVKAESIEKNRVSIGSGDKIDIVTEETTESQGFFSTMLSAIGTGFAKLFE